MILIQGDRTRLWFEAHRIEEILGATDMNGWLQFLVKWERCAKADLVDAERLNIGFPNEVIAFYEKFIRFTD